MCYDRSFLYAWNLQKRGFKADEPMFSIETSVMEILFLFYIYRHVLCVLSSIQRGLRLLLVDLSMVNKNNIFMYPF